MLSTRSMLKELDRIENLPTLPPIAMRVNAMLQDMDTSIKNLSDTIEKDQAIASKILRLVNSAFFGLSSRVGNIQHALVLLGFNTVRNAVVTVSVIKSFSDKETPNAFDVKGFWKHGIAAAVTSRQLALLSRIHPPDDAFIAGLLHDIGKFVLFCYFRDDFLRVWEQVRDGGCTFYEAEKTEVGICHDKIGGWLAKKWKLPENLIDAILYHHNLSKNPGNSSLPLLVHAADIFANGRGSSAPVSAIFEDVDPEAKKVLGPFLGNESSWFHEISEDIDLAFQLLLEA